MGNKMSRETINWLNTNVLVGMTDKRGNAWHYRADEQGAESNHYAGAIPVADVERRLFDWEPLEGPVYFPVTTGITPDGKDVVAYTEIPSKKRIYPSNDETHTFGLFAPTYQAHGFKEWLIGNVSNILTDTLNISSAGLLRNRAVAWVEISVPENVETPEGITFRPNLLATTSLDGTIATTYKRTTTMTVCDNTMAMALAEDGQTYKRRHTSKSNSKAEQDRARETLDMLTGAADAISAELQRLCEWTISDVQMAEVIRLDAVDKKTGKLPETKTGITVMNRKHDELMALYRNDQRVAPWKGTAFGVLQTFNTWEHHVKGTRGETSRADRNMMAAINGETDRSDAAIMALIDQAYETA
jgi:phage/plasmid-like protein (TIGR03299 family)